MKIQLWAYRPGSDDYVILPHPISFQAGMVLSDLSTLQLVYPLDGAHVDALDPEPNGVFAGVDVEVRVWDGTSWKLATNGRYELTDIESDPVQEKENPTRTYTFQSWGARPLWSVKQGQITGLNKDGKREFIGQSIAQVATTLISEAQLRGDVPNLTVVNTVPSGGDAPAIEPGVNLGTLLNNARDEGKLEWVFEDDSSGQGRRLAFHSSIGTDLSGSVALREGLDFKQAPSHWSSRDMTQATLVQGDNGAYVVVVGPGGTGPYGNNMDFITASGIDDPTGLTLIGNTRVARGEEPRVEHTRDLILDNARFVPFVDYNLGDTILAPNHKGVMSPLRVRQITLTFGEDGYGANVVLGDRFSERILRLERATKGIVGDATSLGGSGTTPDDTGYKIDEALDEFWENELEPELDVLLTGKNRIHWKTVAPTVNDEGVEGDTWFVSNGLTPPAATAIYKHNGTTWTLNQIDQASLRVAYLSALSADLGTVNAGELNAVNINGSTITGSLIRTAASGKRVELSVYADMVTMYDGTTNNVGTVDMSGGAIRLRNVSGTDPLVSSDSFVEVSPAGVTIRGATGGILSASNMYVGSSGITMDGPNINFWDRGSGSRVYLGRSPNTSDENIDIRPGGQTYFSSGAVIIQAGLHVRSLPTGTHASVSVNSSGVFYKASSSLRYKHDIKTLDLGNPLDLNPVSFRYNDTPETVNYGLIAEEVEKVFPELVNYDEDGKPDSVQYSNGWVVLLPLLKDMNNRLQALEERYES